MNEKMRLYLEISGSKSSAIGPLETPIVIGRGDDADVKLDDRWASRRHCEIDHDHGSPVLRDLQSTHGTWVDGSPVMEASLAPGAEVVVGLTRLTVHWGIGIDQLANELPQMNRASERV